MKSAAVSLREGTIHHSSEDGVFVDEGEVSAESLVCFDNVGDDGPGCNE